MIKRLAIALALFGVANVCSAQVTTTNLISYWKLDEASGNATDAHGTNTLTDNGTVGSDTGKINTAREFLIANSEYLSIADNTDLSVGDINFSIAGWVYLDDLTVDQYLISKYNTTGDQREYALAFINGSPDVFRFIVSTAGTSGVVVDSPATLTSGTWYFVAGGHSASADEIWISVNAATPTLLGHTTGVFDGTSAFQIGARPTAAGLFSGRIDEASMWKKDIRANLSDLYASGSGLAYPFTGALAPTITSSDTFSMQESTRAVGTVTATGDGPITFAITGGADQLLFDIDADTGVITAPGSFDFENPEDSNVDNDYVIEVTATGAESPADTQVITITVTDEGGNIVNPLRGGTVR